MKKLPFAEFGADYVNRLIAAAESAPLAEIERLAAALIDCWRGDRQYLYQARQNGCNLASSLAEHPHPLPHGRFSDIDRRCLPRPLDVDPSHVLHVDAARAHYRNPPNHRTQ